MPAINDTSQLLHELRKTIQWDGVRSALQKLNRYSDHRFTGLFLFDGDNLRNTVIVDRTIPDPNLMEPFPANTSYCLLMKETGKPLKITNAPIDERFVGHPNREVVQSYCGAPLRDGDGEIFGAVCSFSTVPCDAEDTLLPVLSGFAAILLECERLQEIGWRKIRTA